MLSESFPQLYSLFLGHKCSIAGMVRFSSMQFSWDFRFFRNLNDRELRHCSNLLGVLGVHIDSMKEDKRAGALEKSRIFQPNGTFSVLSMLYRSFCPLLSDLES